MKKSKFLKKSLAMLLAVMLVVAMIPLSASAAAPNLREVWVGEQQLTPEDGVYTGTIPDTSTSLELNVLAGDGNTVYYTNEEAAAGANEVVAESPADTGNNYWTIDIDNLRPYTSNGVVTVEFSVADSDNPNGTRVEATAELTMVPVDAETKILEFTITSDAGTGHPIPQLGETKITDKTVEITVPYDAATGA